jgi:hypothetical protein
MDVVQEPDVVGQGNPVQHRPAHHDVEGGAAGHERTELLYSALEEALVREGLAASFVQEGRLRLQPDHQPLGHAPGHRRREVARPTPEVEDVIAGTQGQRLEKRLVMHAVVSCVGRVERAVPRWQRLS